MAQPQDSEASKVSASWRLDSERASQRTTRTRVIQSNGESLQAPGVANARGQAPWRHDAATRCWNCRRPEQGDRTPLSERRISCILHCRPRARHTMAATSLVGTNFRSSSSMVPAGQSLLSLRRPARCRSPFVPCRWRHNPLPFTPLMPKAPRNSVLTANQYHRYLMPLSD